jgi:squalene synthase HpnC
MSQSGAVAFNTPSGKQASDENFPVGSFLLPAHLRPHVATFYAFARNSDDISDNSTLAPDDKVERLDRLEAALNGEFQQDLTLTNAHEVRRSLNELGIGVQHAIDLLSAFKQHAKKNRYASWAELMDYCERSANPVGRYLLDIHGENKEDYVMSDALCGALQVINHLQDIKDDYIEMNRVYLPADWMAAHNVELNDLAAQSASKNVRALLDQCIAGVQELLTISKPLALGMKSRRLAAETAAIQQLAETLAKKLSYEDPIATRVALPKAKLIAYAFSGVAMTMTRRLFSS